MTRQGARELLLTKAVFVPLLVLGAASHAPMACAELYDPATRTFTATGDMTMGRWGHAATPLPSGRVLINDLETAFPYRGYPAEYSR
jgi:hypothetical protein